MPKLTHIFIDMDGVLADFISAAFRAHGQEFDAATYPRCEWEITRVLGTSDSDFWAVIDALPDFWRNLPSYPWFRDLLDEAEETGCEVRILTTPSRHGHSYRGKREWLDDHGIGIPAILFGNSRDKALLARSDRLLIDDSGKNVDMFRKAGGQAILFPQVWNENYDLADDPMATVRQHFAVLLGGVHA